jgi:hypothetical protein
MMPSKILKLLLLLVLCGSPLYGQACGEERWPVKTLSDKEGIAVAQKARIASSVVELSSMEPPTGSEILAADEKRFPQERYVYEVKILVIGFMREADSDFHIVIADKSNRLKTMISEIPAGHCAKGEVKAEFDDLQKRFEVEFGKPTSAYKKLPKPIPATFWGVGFFDKCHGQLDVDS